MLWFLDLENSRRVFLKNMFLLLIGGMTTCMMPIVIIYVVDYARGLSNGDPLFYGQVNSFDAYPLYVYIVVCLFAVLIKLFLTILRVSKKHVLFILILALCVNIGLLESAYFKVGKVLYFGAILEEANGLYAISAYLLFCLLVMSCVENIINLHHNYSILLFFGSFAMYEVENIRSGLGGEAFSLFLSLLFILLFLVGVIVLVVNLFELIYWEFFVVEDFSL